MGFARFVSVPYLIVSLDVARAEPYAGAGFSRPGELLTVAGPSGLFTQFPCYPGRVEL